MHVTRTFKHHYAEVRVVRNRGFLTTAGSSGPAVRGVSLPQSSLPMTTALAATSGLCPDKLLLNYQLKNFGVLTHWVWFCVVLFLKC